MTPKEKFRAMTTVELVEILANYRQQTELAAPILAMNPLPMPIQDWIKLRDANQELLHFIALINQELSIREAF